MKKLLYMFVGLVFFGNVFPADSIKDPETLKQRKKAMEKFRNYDKKKNIKSASSYKGPTLEQLRQQNDSFPELGYFCNRSVWEVKKFVKNNCPKITGDRILHIGYPLMLVTIGVVLPAYLCNNN